MSNAPEIIPTVTSQNVHDVPLYASRFATVAHAIQIDIQDGVFVPNLTFTAKDLLTLLRGLLKNELDVYHKVIFDFHLMLTDYDDALQALAELSTLISIRHIFAHLNFPSSPDMIERWTSPIKNASICPAVNPDDPPIEDIVFAGAPAHTYPAIQIMTIHPGPQGQVFIPEQLERVKRLRDAGYGGKIFLDGGINPASMPLVHEVSTHYPISAVCVGSYFSRAPNYEISRRLYTLQSSINL